MSPIATKCTLHCLFAEASPAAIVYRRGPSNHTCLIASDRSDDSFRVGQWFKGKVKPRWGGLSPNGQWLVSFLGKFTGPFITWTVLSKPPYFTAVSLWPVGHTWYGGGWFLSDHEMVLRHPDSEAELAPGFLPPPGIAVLPYGSDARPEIDRRSAVPWRRDAPGERAPWTGPHGHVLETSGERERVVRESAPRSGEEYVAHRVLIGGARPIALPTAGWAHFDSNGDLLFSDGGRLYRLAAAEIGKVGSQAEFVAAARCLADFTGLTFLGLPAPYETPRPEPFADDHPSSGFLPRLDRTTREDRRAAKRQRRHAEREALMGFQ